MGKVHTAGIGRNKLQFIAGMRLILEGGGKSKTEATLLCNPAELENAKDIGPGLIDNAFDKTGDVMLAGSLVSTGMTILTVLTLVGCRGFEKATADLVESALPPSPHQFNKVILSLQKVARENTEKIEHLRSGTRGGGTRGGGGGGSSGEGNGGGDADGGDVGGGDDGAAWYNAKRRHWRHTKLGF